MDSDMEGPSSEELKAQLEAMTAALEQINEALEPISAAKAALTKEEQEAYAAYQAVAARARAEKLKLDNAAFEAQSKANELKREVERQKQLLTQQLKNEELKATRLAREAELRELNAKWSKLTMAAPWREWAKDHQISAGHTLTEYRKVILADPMGLGKTLSAIIACDMIEAASREASPEFPFLGEEEDVYIGGQYIVKAVPKPVDPWTSVDDKISEPNFETVEEWVAGHYEKQIVGSITRPVGKRVLYFCPASLIRNVEREFRMWAGHRNVTFVGGMTKPERKYVFDFVLKNTPDFVVICNYEAWRKDLNLIQQMIDLDPDVIILDEAHIVKDTKTIAYRGVKQLLAQSKPAYIIPMTGTPILNRPQELFSLLTLVNPKEFNHLNDFLFTYCEQDMNKFWKFKPGGLDRIAKRIRKNFLRRTRDQAGIVLPDMTVINHDLEVDADAYPNQALIREQMARYMVIMIDQAKGKAITAAAMIAMFTRLRQIETWPAGIQVKDPITKEITMKVEVEESQKVDYVISNGPDEDGIWNGLIPEVIADERVVLFSQFEAPLTEIKRRVELSGYRAVVLNGTVNSEQRDVIANDFDARTTPKREDSKWDIVLCNYKVGGVGLNFTAATQAIILDEEWNPGKRDQAYGRLHRIGQENPVTVHVVRNQKTIDDWLSAILAAKEGLVDGFNAAMIDVKDFKDFLEGGGLA